MSVFPLLHGGDHRLHRVEHAGEVDVHNILPLGFSHLVDRTVADDAGGGYQGVDLPPPGQDGIGRRLALLILPHVALYAHKALPVPPLGLQPGDGCVQRLLGEVRESHLCSLTQQPLSSRLGHVTRTGDQHHFILITLHIDPSFLKLFVWILSQI